MPPTTHSPNLYGRGGIRACRQSGNGNLDQSPTRRFSASTFLVFSAGFFRLILASIVVLDHISPLQFGLVAVYEFFILSGYWIPQMWAGKYSKTRSP